MSLGSYNLWALGLAPLSFIIQRIYVKIIANHRLRNDRCIVCGYPIEMTHCSECGADRAAVRLSVRRLVLWIVAGLVLAHVAASFQRIGREGIWGLVPTTCYVGCSWCENAGMLAVGVRGVCNRYGYVDQVMAPLADYDISSAYSWQRRGIIVMLAKGTVVKTVDESTRGSAKAMSVMLGLEDVDERCAWASTVVDASDDVDVVAAMAVTGVYPLGSVPDTAVQFMREWESREADQRKLQRMRKVLRICDRE